MFGMCGCGYVWMLWAWRGVDWLDGPVFWGPGYGLRRFCFDIVTRVLGTLWCHRCFFVFCVGLVDPGVRGAGEEQPLVRLGA